jgi:microcystin-dependent protein
MDNYIGIIMSFGFNFDPQGWALCQGQLLSIDENTALFVIIGTTYGGDGQTTFALPDLRGRVAVGVGQGSGLNYISLGEQAGTQAVTLTSMNLPIHTHTATVAQGTDVPKLNAVSETGNMMTPTGNYLAARRSATNARYNANGTPVALQAGTISDITGAIPLPSVTLGAVGGSQSFSIMKPYLGINYSIAIEGVFPSQG